MDSATSSKPAAIDVSQSALPADGGIDGVPRYRWIREQLLRKVVDGSLQRGQQLPGEGQLAKQYGVSLGTMRKAIDGLVEQHVLVRRQGKRTFIAPRDSATAVRLSFHMVGIDDAKELPAFDDVLAITSRPASTIESKRLERPAGTEMIEVRRTRRFSSGDKMFELVILPKSLFPNFAKRLGRQRPSLLYEFYEQKYGINVMNFEERLRAVLANPEQARVIGCKQGLALLEIERVAFDFNQQPVEMRLSYCETQRRCYLHGRK
jgi:GntR family transcriptional regulator